MKEKRGRSKHTTHLCKDYLLLLMGSCCVALVMVLRLRAAQRQDPLHCVALRCVALRCVALRCVALRCVALRCVALRCVALRCVACGKTLVVHGYGVVVDEK